MPVQRSPSRARSASPIPSPVRRQLSAEPETRTSRRIKGEDPEYGQLLDKPKPKKTTMANQAQTPAAPAVATDEKKLRHLMRGVKSEIFGGLIRNPPTTVDEFVTEATNMERALLARARHYERHPGVTTLATSGSDLGTDLPGIRDIILVSDASPSATSSKPRVKKKKELTPGQEASVGRKSQKEVASTRRSKPSTKSPSGKKRNVFTKIYRKIRRPKSKEKKSKRSKSGDEVSKTAKEKQEVNAGAAEAIKPDLSKDTKQAAPLTKKRRKKDVPKPTESQTSELATRKHVDVPKNVDATFTSETSQSNIEKSSDTKQPASSTMPSTLLTEESKDMTDADKKETVPKQMEPPANLPQQPEPPKSVDAGAAQDKPPDSKATPGGAAGPEKFPLKEADSSTRTVLGNLERPSESDAQGTDRPKAKRLGPKTSSRATVREPRKEVTIHKEKIPVRERDRCGVADFDNETSFLCLEVLCCGCGCMMRLKWGAGMEVGKAIPRTMNEQRDPGPRDRRGVVALKRGVYVLGGVK
ncbi:hypothetical protein HPB47_027632 [Ixodes persulcatus]|uniref:Uncharacterized protein n=1 Tax=Ixodes persulcatus TaxID=34615 RepID=A0AC60PXD8_IXOPE|nr:hypothetical protein HPB47_027632 [Ixodes persulcatus]